MLEAIRSGDKITFLYKNHRDIVARRNIGFDCIKYGSNNWYPEPQLFIHGLDFDKEAVRSFAVSSIIREIKLI